MEDQIMNYILLTKTKSFYFSKRIGYYYLKNEMSISKHKYEIGKIRIKFIFIYLKILFEYSKNTKYEKDMLNLLFTKLFSNDVLNFFNYIINLYLNCIFITKENKIYFKNLQL